MEVLMSAEISIPPTTRRTGADRMREARERRRDGYRCATAEISSAEVDALVAHGFLAAAERDSRKAIEAALGRVLDKSDLVVLIERAAQAAAQRRGAPS